MKRQQTTNRLRFALAMTALFICGLVSVAVAAPLAQIPTSPITGYFASGETTPTPDYYTTANWANSPPLAKFVDTLPGLNSANNLGNSISVAVPNKTKYPGSDYYVIALVQYTQKLHSDLQPTTLRGYVQLEEDGSGKVIRTPSVPPSYLGPVILAERDRPVRIKFIPKSCILNLCCEMYL